MDTSTRLKGHGLQPVGFGLCACGARSDVLDSDYARRVWHRGHKDEVRAAMEASR